MLAVTITLSSKKSPIEKKKKKKMSNSFLREKSKIVIVLVQMQIQREFVEFQIDHVGQRIRARVQFEFAVRLVQHVRMSDVPEEYGVFRVVVVHLYTRRRHQTFFFFFAHNSCVYFVLPMIRSCTLRPTRIFCP